MPDPARELLRHCLATVAYRGGKTLREAPLGFGDFRLGPDTRTPVEILAHVADLFDWALHLAKGEHVWRDSKPLAWPAEVDRFFAAVALFDLHLASDTPLGFPAEQLFQGPIADALMHFGQIAMLRRRAGGPVRGENYFRADIKAGRVGPEQAEARVEFD